MLSNRFRLFIALGVIAAFVAIFLAFSPLEATLGSGIRSVYVHVMFTGTGRLGLTLVGAMGAVVLLTGNRRIHSWAQTIGWVGLGLFSTGIVASMISAQINWGAVFWDEPRFKSATQIAAFGLLIQILNTWVPWVRVRGLLHIALTAFSTLMILNAELVLHPRSPILTSNSMAIQMTFGVLLLACIVAAGLVIWHLRQNTEPGQQWESS